MNKQQIAEVFGLYLMEEYGEEVLTWSKEKLKEELLKFCIGALSEAEFA